MKGASFYQPFTYQPALASYYMGAPMPAELQQVALNNPGKAQHLTSIWQFSTWLNQYFPEFYNLVSGTRPDLLDAGAVVTTGKLNAGSAVKASGAAGLSGLGQTEDTPPTYDVTLGETPSGTTSSAITEWGKMLTDLAKQYLTVDAQKKLIDLNIKRAEQGLPPLDSNTVAAGVNVGLSPQAQTLAYLAIGGLVIVGLLAALKKR